jgi:hypothetical protein
MKKIVRILFVAILLFATGQNLFSQVLTCNKDDVYFVINQPKTATGMGSVTFYAKRGGYYINHAQTWVSGKLFTGGTWPGNGSSFTFNNLPVGTYSFNTYLPANAPADINWPSYTLDIICNYYVVTIQPTGVSTNFNVKTVNATTCDASGQIQITSLPTTTNYGVRWPGQPTFVSTAGADSVASPIALVYKPGRYFVEITSNFPTSTNIMRVPVEIFSNSGQCVPLLGARTYNATSCADATVWAGAGGVPENAAAPFYQYKYSKETWTGNANWSGLTNGGVNSQAKPGKYFVDILTNGNLGLTETYRMPYRVNSSTGACNGGNAVSIATTRSAQNSTNCTALTNSGRFALSGLIGQSAAPLNGVKFPTQTVFSAPDATGYIASPAILAAGNYAIEYNDDVTNAASPSGLIAITMPRTNAAGTGDDWSCAGPHAAYQTSAANANACNSTTNRTITIGNLPTTANSICYRFPGETSFTLKTTTGTTVTSPLGYAPGIYLVAVNTSTVAANANNNQGTTFYYQVTILRTGGCTPTALTAANFTTTNTSYWGAADGAISLTIPTTLQNTALAIRWPGMSHYMVAKPGASSIKTPKYLHLPAGTYTVQYMYGPYQAWVPINVSVTIGTGNGAAHPRPASAYTTAITNATNCTSKNGRITVNGFYAGERAGVLFPNYTEYLIPNSATATSITSPGFMQYGPGTYTVKVKTDVYTAASAEYTYNVTIAAATGACAGAPTLTVTATNLANCADSNAVITIAGFNANQNYGVIFPGSGTIIAQATAGGSLTSPPGCKIKKGAHRVTVIRDVTVTNSDFYYIDIFVNGPGGVECPKFMLGVAEEPSCDARLDTMLFHDFGATGMPRTPTANGNLVWYLTTEFNKVDLSCDQPQDNNYAIVNTTNLAGLTPACPAANNNRVFGNFQISDDHTGNPGGNFVLLNGAYDERKLFEAWATPQTVCGSTEYNFSIWVKDFEPYLFGNIYNFQTIRPILSFWINDVEVDRDTLGSNIVYAQGEETTWYKLGFKFTTANSNYTKMAVKNAAPGGIGNDFAFDDLLITRCVPNANLYVPLNCVAGSALTLYANFNGGTMMPSSQMRWLRNGTPITAWEPTPGTPQTYSGAYNVGDVFTVQLADGGNTATPTMAAPNFCLHNTNSFALRARGTSCIVLSADQFAINGKASSTSNIIDWNFAHHNATNKYVVQFSLDGKNFDAATVLNNASTITGKLLFNHSIGGTNNYYYRVKAILNNGEEVYSPSVLVKRNNATTDNLSLINTIVDNGKIRFLSNKVLGQVPVKILNLEGKIMQSSLMQVNTGINEVIFTNKNIAKGYYLIALNTPEGAKTFKILVQ